jgi:hypothetical protein
MLSNKQLGKLARGVFFGGPSFVYWFKFNPVSPHDPPTHKRLLRNLALGYAGEYFCVVRTLAPFSLTPMSSDTTLILIALHFKSDGYFPLFIKDYELD